VDKLFLSKKVSWYDEKEWRRKMVIRYNIRNESKAILDSDDDVNFPQKRITLTKLIFLQKRITLTKLIFLQKRITLTKLIFLQKISGGSTCR
jgi:hypothetical protein